MRGNSCIVPLLRKLRLITPLSNVKNIHFKQYPDCSEESKSSKPLKFSTSKASHRNWTVDKSLGSDETRPLWKVIPVSVFLTAFLLWAVFREETDLDQMIYNPIEKLQEENEKK
ncbi:hypothetical protein GDO86_017348 [Hymenochirus boettgeri]|uniref:Uncharacterized protein n=1 Tax=Hymenochirus boettgeri TaxID=247094 RepID=A0A8T2IJT2_9PIPI|nr:hypothetical protein GDO86_017348 [Hymenochirus boettgeri]